MYQNCCKKCGSLSLHTEVKGNNVGLYCDDCGAWVKWLSKDELRAFEYSQESKLPKTSCSILMPKVAAIHNLKLIAILWHSNILFRFHQYVLYLQNFDYYSSHFYLIHSLKSTPLLL